MYSTYRTVISAWCYTTATIQQWMMRDRMFITNGHSPSGVESYRAMLKRGHQGVYRYLSPKRLQRYVNETRRPSQPSKVGRHRPDAPNSGRDDRAAPGFQRLDRMTLPPLGTAKIDRADYRVFLDRLEGCSAHSRGEYVRGKAHANTMESFWHTIRPTSKAPGQIFLPHYDAGLLVVRPKGGNGLVPRWSEQALLGAAGSRLRRLYAYALPTSKG